MFIGVLAVGVGSVRAHAEDDDVVQEREPVGAPQGILLVCTRRVEIEPIKHENHRPASVRVLGESIRLDRPGGRSGQGELWCFLADANHATYFHDI